jgi:GH15 family glucan-1,4-alpha-glucosidase
MNGEINILGAFVPALLIYAALAFGLKEIVCRLLLRLGAYQFVWHRPLFDSALFVLLLGGVVLAAHRINL